jgi:hypothetical protein
MIFFQLVLGFLIGSRGYLFLNGLVALAAMNYTGYLRERPRRIIWGSCIIVVLLMVGIIFVTPFRELKIARVGFDRPAGLGEAADIYQDIGATRKSEDVAQTLTNFWDLVTQRANNMESLALVLERADKVQHLERAYGIDNNMLYDFTWGLVPRFLYPDKPIMSEFAVKFGHIYHDLPASMRSWSNPTIMGDLYRNVGYPGLILGMFILGIFLRLMYVALVENNRYPVFFVAFFFSVMGMNFEGTYVGLFHGLIRLWVMLAVFGGLLSLLYHFFQGPASQWRPGLKTVLRRPVPRHPFRP